MAKQGTILIDGMPCLREAVLAETGAAADVDVYPGMLVERHKLTQGGKDYYGVRRNRLTGTGNIRQILVAIEEDIAPELTYNDNTRAIDKPYKAGGANAADISKAGDVRFGACRPGDRVLLRVAANAPAITYGDHLEVDNTAAAKYGTVKKTGAAADLVVAVACEDLDNSGSSVSALILAEIV